MAAQRILVMGASGTGKSTLARRIGDRLGVPVVHLDRLFWRAGWIAAPNEEFIADIATAASGEAWVMDGNYTRTLGLRLPRADTVVWLDLPRRVYFPRVLWRTARNFGSDRSDLADGCPERFDRDFIFSWVWGYPSRARARQAEVMASLPVHVHGITLSSRSAVRAFETGLPGTLETSR